MFWFYTKKGIISGCKLCDFGVSKVISESTMANTYLGTFRWISPEILSKTQEGYTTQTDIWSYGMVIYELLTLKNPYYEIADPEEISKCILNGIFPKFPNDLDKSMGCFEKLMGQCLQLNPALRPTSRIIVDYLNSISNQLILGEEVKDPMFDYCSSTIVVENVSVE